jgi:hypothetical protein
LISGVLLYASLWFLVLRNCTALVLSILQKSLLCRVYGSLAFAYLQKISETEKERRRCYVEGSCQEENMEEVSIVQVLCWRIIWFLLYEVQACLFSVPPSILKGSRKFSVLSLDYCILLLLFRLDFFFGFVFIWVIGLPINAIILVAWLCIEHVALN